MGIVISSPVKDLQFMYSACVTKLSWLCSSKVTYAKNCTSEEVSLLGLLELTMAILDCALTLAVGR